MQSEVNESGIGHGVTLPQAVAAIQRSSTRSCGARPAARGGIAAERSRQSCRR
ncbi:hypothetical protein roselon_00367 [Roseibacterium elongatum DSM 19469]|uniref:Uncharacterized protein n=1 Tax=Roseicyclus elongatus DSM 19469 TaxID=1294273 RepID=W8RY88_9RHOB|nr:hypothetical protein roselon_00367 [Roseibacterium elongatum DSM 19469]